MGSGDQRTRGPEGRKDQRNSVNRAPAEHWGNRRYSDYRGPVEQWVQRTREQRLQRTGGTVGTEDQWSSGYRGPVEQCVQRTRGTVGSEEL